MKITVFTLCVVFPSLCVCTPLPDYGGMPTSDGGGSCPSSNPQPSPPPPASPPSPPGPNPSPPSGGGCDANTGKPDTQGFTNYSVLKMCFEEFKTKINKITWHLAKYTPSSEEVKSDVTVCADRYIKDCECCKAVKFQYVIEKNGFVVKEWGLTDKLIYIQEEITASSQEFVILKAEVKNVMKAEKDSDKAVGVGDDKQVKSYLNSEYAVLGTDYKNFFIGQTSCDKGAITFIAFIEDIYLCEEKQQQFAEQISQILKCNGIDESKLQKLTQKFDVDTNKYNKKNKDKGCHGNPSGLQPPPSSPQPEGHPPYAGNPQGPQPQPQGHPPNPPPGSGPQPGHPPCDGNPPGPQPQGHSPPPPTGDKPPEGHPPSPMPCDEKPPSGPGSQPQGHPSPPPTYDKPSPNPPSPPPPAPMPCDKPSPPEAQNPPPPSNNDLNNYGR